MKLALVSAAAARQERRERLRRDRAAALTLRTVFPDTDGEPYQKIIDPSGALVPLATVEVGEDGLQQALRSAAGYEFDLAAEISFRPVLLILGPEQHVLLLVMHHIVMDGWSVGPLLRDLASAYEARCDKRAADWAPLPVQYADYALWQQEALGSADDPDSLLSEQLAYWGAVLADLPEIALPTDRPRPAAVTHRGGAVPVSTSADLHRSLLAIARESRATLFMALQAGLALLLARLGAGTDIPLGTAVAGRTDEALDNLVGFFVNTLVLRTDVSGDPTFRELVRRVADADLAAFTHQDVPFDRLVEALNPVRTLDRHPLFQIMLVLQNNAETEPDFRSLVVKTGTVELNPAKFDLTLDLCETRDADGQAAGICGALKFATDLWDEASAAAMADRFVRLLEAVAAEAGRPVSRAGVLSRGEQHRIAVEWNDTAVPFPADLSLSELFECQVDLRPDAVALISGRERVSFADLDGRANRLALRRAANPWEGRRRRARSRNCAAVG